MDSLRQDLRFAVRQIRRSPGVTLVPILSIALGIGANTLVFSFVRALLLAPLPFAEPDRLVSIRTTTSVPNVMVGALPWADYAELPGATTTFEGFAAHLTGFGLTLTEGGEAERVEVELVSAELFPLLGVEPLLGRNIRKDEDQPDRPLVVILSYELWQRRFGGDPEIIGRTILGNSLPYEVIGVMPPGFRYPEDRQQGWVPLRSRLQEDPQRIQRTLRLVGRLRPGASVADARTEVTRFGERLARTWPSSHTGWGLTAVPLRDGFLAAVAPGLRQSLLLALGAVSCVLLIACANVANLLLARTMERHREMAVRAAFGASRRRIVRQLLTESLVIAGTGGALGIILALGGVRLVCEALPLLPPWASPKVDGMSLLFTLGTTLASGLFFGMVPALQAARIHLSTALKDGARSTEGLLRHRLRTSLVIAEVAIAVVLLVGAALFLRSFLELRKSTASLASDNLLSVWFYLPGDAYRTGEARSERIEDVLRRVEALPGVDAAAAANSVPFVIGAAGGETRIQVLGPPGQPARDAATFSISVSSGVFRTLGVPIVAGRDLTRAEALDSSGLALVNETMARQLWPEGALGRRFRIVRTYNELELTVIGIAADTQYENREEPRSEIYVPLAYHTGRPIGLVLRASHPIDELIPGVRRAIRASDPGLPIFQVTTLAAARDRNFSFERLFGLGFAVFAGGALFLAAIGVYGMLSYLVSRRAREIGIRLALGAGRWSVVRLVVGQGLLLTLAGVALGLLAAFAGARALDPLLYRVSPDDPLSFAGTAILLIDVAFVACYLPARRALDVEPVEVMREIR
jgi:putative ABC transport system permease protein